MAGIELATGYVQLVASATGIQSSITDALTPAAGAAGSSAGAAASSGITAGASTGFSGIAKMATGLLAGGAAVGFLKSATAEAAESAKVGALTAQVIKTTGGAAGVTADQVNALAGSISAKSGIDDEAIQSGQNLLLTFTGVKDAAGAGNDIFTQASGLMTDMSVAMGTDASGAAIQLGKALNDPATGMTALSRSGVSFTDAQKAQIKTLQDSGDTLGAQKIILGELSKEFGGAAEAAALPADKLKVAWGNFQESVGTALAPMMNKISDALTAIMPTVVSMLPVLVPLVAAFAGMLVVSKLISIVKGFSQVMGVFNAVMAMNPIVLIVIAIIALIAGFILLWKHSEAFRNFWIGLWDKLKGVVKVVVDWIVDRWNDVLGFIGGVPGKVWGFLKFLWDKITAAATAVKDWIVDRWNDVLGFIGGVPGKVWGFLKFLWDKVTDAATAVRDWIAARWNDVITFVAGIPAAIWSWLVGLWDKVLAGATAAYDWIAARWNDVITFVEGIPARVWDGLSTIWGSVQEAAKTAVGWVTDAWDGLVGWFADLGTRIWDALKTAFGWITDSISSILEGLGLIQGTKLDTDPSKVAGNPLQRIPGRAGGGILPAGWAMVGERGPELVNTAGGARVFSSRDSAGMLAGVGGTATVHIVNTFGADSVRQASDITDLTRAVARETNRALRAAGVAVPISGAA